MGDIHEFSIRRCDLVTALLSFSKFGNFVVERNVKYIHAENISQRIDFGKMFNKV